MVVKKKEPFRVAIAVKVRCRTDNIGEENGLSRLVSPQLFVNFPASLQQLIDIVFPDLHILVRENPSNRTWKLGVVRELFVYRTRTCQNQDFSFEKAPILSVLSGCGLILLPPLLLLFQLFGQGGHAQFAPQGIADEVPIERLL